MNDGRLLNRGLGAELEDEPVGGGVDDLLADVEVRQVL